MLDLSALVAYNVWANTLLLDVLPSHPDEDLDAERISSFPSLRKTWYHIWDAETIWLKRLQGHSPESWPSKEFGPDFSDFGPYLLQTSAELRDFVAAQSVSWAGLPCSYRTLNQDGHNTPNGVVVQHVVNHSSYHRGQLITLMRQVGWTELPSTDLMRWYRKEIAVSRMENEG